MAMNGLLKLWRGATGVTRKAAETVCVRLPLDEPVLRLLLEALSAMGHRVRANTARGSLLVSSDAVSGLVSALRGALAEREATVRTLKKLERRARGSAPSSPWAVADALSGGARAQEALAPAVAAACAIGPLLRRAESAALAGASLLVVRSTRR